jgi:predicted transposase YbfD/YdcC
VSSATATVSFTTTTPEILAHFNELTDPRIDRTRLHALTDLVAIALCAAICGAAGWADVERFGRMKRDWFARFLKLTGAVVTLDALHCQTETARAIRAKGADYVLTVKGNQPTLRDQIQQLFVDAGEVDYQVPGLKRHVTTEQSHGRFERREYYVLPAPKALRETGQWADLASVGMVYRHRELRDRETDEVVFFISSLPPAVRKLARHLRGHWGIENSLHWVLDVTFTEDASRIRTGSAPVIAAIFRRLALSILQQDRSLKSSIRGKRLQAGWNNDILEAILTGNAWD